MKDIIWHSDNALGVSIGKLGESITYSVKADSFNYGNQHNTSLKTSNYMRIVCDVILPEICLRYEPRWTVDVLQTGSSVELSSNQEIDFMLLPRGLCLGSNHLKDTITEDSINPGFVYVCLDEEQDRSIIETWEDCCIEKDGKLYLSSEIILQKFFELIKQVCLNTLCKVLDKVNVIMQGPAVKLSVKSFPNAPAKVNENPNEHLVENLPTPEVNHKYDFEFDLVLAISCRSWPISHISVFKDRIHNSQKTIIKSEIIEFFKVGNSETVNFHIVPKPSRINDRNERLEWRLSFSLLEKDFFYGFDFARSLTPSAGFAYQALKEWKEMISAKCNKVISTYHLKTVYFWMLEGINDQVYTSLCKGLPKSALSSHKIEETYFSTGNMFVWMVEILVDFILQKNMPHYFCHNLNLFENKDEMDFNILCEEAKKLKTDPFLEHLTLHELLVPLLLGWKEIPKKEVDTSYDWHTMELLGMQHEWETRWLNARTLVAIDEKRQDEKKKVFFINFLL